MNALSQAWWPATALALVLGVLWLGQRAARAGWIKLPSQSPSSPKILAVVEVVSVDSRRRLQLIRCADRHVLVLTGGPQDVLLGWLPEDNQ